MAQSSFPVYQGRTCSSLTALGSFCGPEELTPSRVFPGDGGGGGGGDGGGGG